MPGCSTGEEAYTIAILLAEEMAVQDKHVPIQIFASDIDDGALEVARAGHYPAGSAAYLSPQQLENYFEKEGGDSLIVNKSLREAVVFARQNLVADPPFSRLDLISCRNLLIYLKQPIQDKLINLFHFALKPGGYLLLGSLEGIGNHTDLFETVVKKWPLYQRNNTPSAQYPELPFSPFSQPLVRSAKTQADANPCQPRLAELASRWLLQEYAPATVIINRRFEAFFLRAGWTLFRLSLRRTQFQSFGYYT